MQLDDTIYPVPASLSTAQRADLPYPIPRSPDESIANFRSLYPEVVTYLETVKNDRELGHGNHYSNFIQSVSSQFWSRGSLTGKQIGAVKRVIAGQASRHTAPNPTAHTAPTAPTYPTILDLFHNAEQAGLPHTSRKIRLLAPGYDPQNPDEADSFVLTAAKPNSANPGAVYITHTALDYLGKITSPAAIFQPAGYARTDTNLRADIAETLASLENNPLETAVAYGQATGRCSCCGRELTNPASIELGIGPICREKWGM